MLQTDIHQAPNSFVSQSPDFLSTDCTQINIRLTYILPPETIRCLVAIRFYEPVITLRNYALARKPIFFEIPPDKRRNPPDTQFHGSVFPEWPHLSADVVIKIDKLRKRKHTSHSGVSSRSRSRMAGKSGRGPWDGIVGKQMAISS